MLEISITLNCIFSRQPFSARGAAPARAVQIGPRGESAPDQAPRAVPARLRSGLASFPDQPLRFDNAAEILLVQADSRERLDGPLRFKAILGRSPRAYGSRTDRINRAKLATARPIAFAIGKGVLTEDASVLAVSAKFGYRRRTSRKRAPNPFSRRRWR